MLLQGTWKLNCFYVVGKGVLEAWICIPGIG